MGSVTAARVAAPTLLEVIPSFQRHLRAENKSPRTIQSYRSSAKVRLCGWFHIFPMRSARCSESGVSSTVSNA